MFGSSKKSRIFASQFRKWFAQMAESVDALVSNTSGFTSIPVRPRVWVQEREEQEFLSFFLFLCFNLPGLHPSLGSQLERITVNFR